MSSSSSNNMESILQLINKKYISLPEHEVRRNNRILNEVTPVADVVSVGNTFGAKFKLLQVLSTFVDKMRTKDLLFKAMFRGVFYGGSYYDGLRVGKPEEFDLDLLMDIPKYAQPVLIGSNIPGFVKLQLNNFDGWMRQPEAQPAYRDFRKLFDDNFFLSSEKVLAWMEGIVQRSLNDFPVSILSTHIMETSEGSFKITFSKTGPALTLHISGTGITIDVDLVPCFVFREDKWPIDSFRSNPFPSSLPEFFIVPKKPKFTENQPIDRYRYWRYSFQEQERALINNKSTLKPTIKLLKKMRDNLQHDRIASYYIKTVLLHIIDQKELAFWKQPLSHVFMTVLKEYAEFIKDENIPYYWNSENNLIGDIHWATLDNWAHRLNLVIRDLENNRDRPEIVAKYFLTRSELVDFLVRAESARYEPEGYNNFSNSDPAFEAAAPSDNQSRCVII